MYACPCEIQECVFCEAQLYTGLSKDHVLQIRGILDKRRYQPQEFLFHETDPSTHLFALRTGHVKLTSSLADGREQIIRLAVPGQLLGLGTVNGDAYPYTARALTSVTVCRLTRKDMLRVLAENPPVSLRVIDHLNGELEQAQAMIRDLGLKSANEKVASFIVSLIPARGPTPEKLVMPLSRQEIAEMLGLTVETVSRVMAQFKREDLIQTPRGHIHIKDQARLWKLAGVSRRLQIGDRPAASAS
jgi:CRP/FNR family transcriptional regulator